MAQVDPMRPDNPLSMSGSGGGGGGRSALLSPSSLGTLASPSPELEVQWDPKSIRSELQMATALLSQRCLKVAARWAAEQLVGLSTDAVEGRPSSSSTNNASDYFQLFHQETDPIVIYAKSLLDLGEYLHAAAILSLPNDNVTTMAPPLPSLSSHGFYLRAYALYMAGERRKEEEFLELQSKAPKQSFVRNPYLTQLCQELLESYKSKELDAFGLYIYGMVLNKAKATNLPLASHPPAYSILVESLLEFPCNWSAWLDLAEVSLHDTSVEQALETRLLPSLGGHYMYHFFCAHLMSCHQAHEDSMVLLDRLMEPTPGNTLFQSPYIVSKLGVLHYHLRQFSQARGCFQQLHAKDPFRVEDLDVYSNVMYVEEDRVGLSQLAHTVVRVDKYRPESCCVVGNYYSLKQQRSKAVLYFQRALKLDKNYMSAWTLMGHEYVEMKNTPAAMEAYRRAVSVSPKDYRAWYGLGQTYEFLNMHLFALYYYRKAVTLRPFDARMWCAIGSCYMALDKTTDAIRSYERAINQGDTEGIATQKLAALYRDKGDSEKAAQCYLRHLELRYLATNPHPPTTTTSLDSIVQHLVVEAPEAEALLYLASYHKRHGEYDTSALFCSRLLEYPGPEKEEAKAFLRELRSRKSGAPRVMHTRSKGPPSWAMDEGNEDSPSFEFSP